MFTKIKERYKTHGKDPEFRLSVIIASAALLTSTVVNYYAGTYATEMASNSVTDVVLSNIRVFDVELIFVYGSGVLTFFIAMLLLAHPKRIPFTLYSLTLFILIRSAFISLTHIAPYPSQAILDLGLVASKFIFGGDLFFSGHTGIPFLMALIFWKEPHLRYFFIVWSVGFGVTALLGHLHYTIDVLSAFFITYTIFHLAEIIFKKERTLFFRDEQADIK